MDTIKFKEDDLQEMRQFYQEELDKTLRRLQHIKSVLEKLGESSQIIQLQFSGSQKGSVPTTGRETEPKSKRRRSPGRQSVWEDIIVKKLKTENRPLSYHELTDAMMRFGQIPESKRESTRRAITNLVFRLKKQKRKLRTFSAGSREKYLALNSWFVADGKIKEEFKPSVPEKKEVKKASAKPASTKPAQAPVSTKPAKTIPTPLWTDYALELLRIEKKPMAVSAMTERAMKRFNIKAGLYGKTRLAVSRSMTQLEKKEKLVKSFKGNDGRSKIYGLVEWFDGEGKVKNEFKS